GRRPGSRPCRAHLRGPPAAPRAARRGPDDGPCRRVRGRPGRDPRRGHPRTGSPRGVLRPPRGGRRDRRRLLHPAGRPAAGRGPHARRRAPARAVHRALLRAPSVRAGPGRPGADRRARRAPARAARRPPAGGPAARPRRRGRLRARRRPGGVLRGRRPVRLRHHAGPPSPGGPRARGRSADRGGLRRALAPRRGDDARGARRAARRPRRADGDQPRRRRLDEPRRGRAAAQPPALGPRAPGARRPADLHRAAVRTPPL
ncbi:MAG: Exopolysaccharide biosynthesis protein, Phosphodiester glycosidase, partial [uncultured Solirubrobacteraceae bacterium]